MKTRASIKSFTSIMAVSFVLSLVCLGHAATFTLEWDPNSELDLAGYRLHYGTASENYSEIIDVGEVTSWEVSGLNDGVTYYFALTAYDMNDNESGYSEEVTARENLPPQASASATPTQGAAPLTVSFVGSGADTDGTIAGYSWDFGDGNTSTQQSPAHTYDSPGSYTAVLTVTDNDGATASSSVQIEAYVSNLPPAATASAEPTSGHSPLTVVFNGSGSDPDGVIVSYHWDFGDESTSNEQNPTHTYSSEGTYTACLTVTDDDGAPASSTVSLQVSPPNQPPTVSSSAAPTEGIAPLTVNFICDASDTDGVIASYSWDFGDGGSSSVQNPSHTYDSEGTYTAELTITDDDGAQASSAISIQVIQPNQSPTVSASATPTSGTPPLTVNFSCNASDTDGVIVSYHWDFGDEGTSNEPKPSHTYDGEGTYTAIVTVTDDDGAQASSAMSIQVMPSNQPPIADAGPDQTVDEGTVVTLDGSNSTDPDDGIASYLWTQTAGTEVSLDDPEAVRPTFTAPQVGEEGVALTFQLTVADFGGAESTDSCIVNVSWVNVPPTADAGPDQTVDEGTVVTLDGSNSTDPDDGLASYHWTQTAGIMVDLDDLSAIKPSFAAPEVTQEGAALSFQLTVTDKGGLKSDDSCIVNVTWVNMPPIADAGPDQTFEEGMIVTLDGSNSTDPDDGIASYHWTQATGTPVSLFDSDKPRASFIAPEVETGEELRSFNLTVTDTCGLQSADHGNVVIYDVDVYNLDPTGPDLAGTWLALKKFRRGPNCWIEGTIRAQNSGTETAPASLVRFYLSHDDALDSSDALIKEAKIKPIDPKQTRNFFLKTKLPWCEANSYLLGVLDANEDVTETDETNNIVVSRPLN